MRRSACARLLPPRHTPRRPAAALSMVLATLLAPAGALAQSDMGAAGVQPPDPQRAMRVWSHVEGWVRDWSVPETLPPGLEPVQGAAITLRHGGVLLADHTLVVDEGDALLPLVREAMLEASENIQFDRDVFFEDRLAAAAERMTISLELAGALVPMTEDNDYERELATNPGLDGLAIRYNDAIEAMSPGIMLATATMPGRALNRIRSDVVDDPALLLQPDMMRGATYYRFRTTHLAQTDPRAAPIFLHRGGRIVSLTSIDTPMLASFADDMARYLLRQRWPGPERLGMHGTYFPTRGRSDPIFADARSQAICAYAMLRYAATPGVTDATRVEARAFAADILADLAVVEDPEEAPWEDPTGAAICLIAFAEAERTGIDLDEGVDTLIATCRGRVFHAFTPEQGFAPDITPAAYGLMAHALGVAALNEDERSLAIAAVRATYQITPLDQLGAQMPWLGWAELELAGNADVPAAAALREMRSLVWEDQFTSADARFGDQDLVGGIVLTGGGMSPLPSWHTARRVAFLSTMLGDDRLTEPGERSAELVRLIRSLRFVRQLCVDEAVSHLCRSPLRARGGIRSSLWDQRMPPDATAFSLLSVTEALRSLDRF